MNRTLIDTRIWALALKVAYMTKSDPDYSLADRAKSLVVDTLKKDRVLVSAQLMGEIYHVATRRGIRLPSDDVVTYLNNLLEKDNVLFDITGEETVKKAIELSSKYNVHVWDFLVVLPFETAVDIIYTMDPHFQNPYFQKIAKLENPLGVWKVEGQR